jgi:DNA-binding beta-propeller fold protein YncE
MRFRNLFGRRRAMAAGAVTAGLALAGFGWGFNKNIELSPAGTYETHIFDDGASEIVSYDARTRRLFVVNAHAPGVDVLDVSDPADPVKIDFIDVSALGGGVNSVAVSRGTLGVAIEADEKTDPGVAAFYDTSALNLLGAVPTGALPDNIVFSKDGRYAFTANEGEPNDDYSIDPEGSVTVIEIKRLFRWFRAEATTVGFERYNGHEDALRADGVRIYGPGASAAQDFEPEYIAVADDGRKAYITLQENNAIAVLDVRRALITDILPLGYKDHSLPGNGLDASDRDDAINIANWPVYGMYQPDGIAIYTVRGKTYLVTANEGDARDYDTFAEEERVKDLELDPTAFPNASDLQEDEAIGRLTVTTALGDTDGDGDFDKLFALGGRSFSIWDERGHLVFDSGDALERITAEAFPDEFNSTNDENGTFDNRSDNKGPEPEGVAIGELRGRTYAFIGLERIGGVAVYDITDPRSPEFVQYINNRDFSGDAEAFTAGDLGPEGIEFIPALESPTHRPMLAVGNEVSGTTTLYEIDFTR